MMSSIKRIAQALASHPPYEVSMSAVNIKHLHTQVYLNMSMGQNFAVYYLLLISHLCKRHECPHHLI